jgi:hypothetical protein
MAGAAAMLATCLTSHPLLLDEVALPFWIVLGLVAGMNDVQEDGSNASSWIGWTVGFAAIALAVFILGRAPLTPSDSAAVTGLTNWETDASGARFRWSGEYASLFVSQNATRVYIPVRQPVDLPALRDQGVSVRAAPENKGRTIVGPTWAILNIELPRIPSRQRYRRIDLKIDRVWQPAVYVAGSSDMRRLGVQVGEVKEFYEY